METLNQIFEREARILREEFAQASHLGRGTPQEISDFRENAFRDFVARFFPHPYRITKGKIRDSFSDSPSLSIDCIVVNPQHPNLLDSQGKFQLLLADGVDHAIEVKPDISVAEELHRGLKQGVSVKRLTRFHCNLLVRGDDKEFAKKVPFLIYTHKSKSPLETCEHVVQWYSENETPLIEQLDFIVINDVGIIENVQQNASESILGDISPPIERGWYFRPWGDLTLGGLLFALHNAYSSQPDLAFPVIQPYLERIAPEKQLLRLQSVE